MLEEDSDDGVAVEDTLDFIYSIYSPPVSLPLFTFIG